MGWFGKWYGQWFGGWFGTLGINPPPSNEGKYGATVTSQTGSSTVSGGKFGAAITSTRSEVS